MTPNSTTSVIFAPINATGSLGAWNLTTRMPLDLSRHSMYVSGDYLYLNGGMWFGGLIPSEFVMFARLLDGGGVGRWTFHNQLIDDTQLHSTVLHNGFAYNLGGAVSSTVTSTVSRTQTMSRNTYWGLSIPGESPAGTYTGTTVFTAVLPP
jgi:hypothetical protein